MGLRGDEIRGLGGRNGEVNKLIFGGDAGVVGVKIAGVQGNDAPGIVENINFGIVGNGVV